MSQVLPIVLVSSLLAGGVGAVASTMLTSKPNIAAADTQVSQADGDLLAELRTLSEQNRAIQERLAALEVGSGLAPIAGATRTDAMAVTPSNLKEAVRDVMASINPDGGPAAGSTQLAAAVESVIEQREERERLQKEQERADAAVKRLEDRLAKLQTDLGLDQSQVNSMREIFQATEARRDGMREEMRTMRENGGSWEDMRTAMQTARDESNAQIQAVLTPGQFTQYEASNQDDRGRGGNTGGGGRGGR